MEVIIGLAVLGLVVWYIYKKVGVVADYNNDGKVDTEDAKVAMDMAVSSVSGMATGAAVAVANVVESKVEEAVTEVKAVVEAKVEEVVAAVETKVEQIPTIMVQHGAHAAEPTEEPVEEVVQKAKKGRKPKAK